MAHQSIDAEVPISETAPARPASTAEVAFVGRSNVGKAPLTALPQDLARSRPPRTHRTINVFLAGVTAGSSTFPATASPKAARRPEAGRA